MEQRNRNGAGDNSPHPTEEAASARQRPRTGMGTCRRDGRGPTAASVRRRRPSTSQAFPVAAGARQAHPPRRRHGEGSRYACGAHPTLGSSLHESIQLGSICKYDAISIVSVCLDGTPPGYHLQTGSGSGSRSWLIHLEVPSITNLEY